MPLCDRIFIRTKIDFQADFLCAATTHLRIHLGKRHPRTLLPLNKGSTGSSCDHNPNATDPETGPNSRLLLGGITSRKLCLRANQRPVAASRHVQYGKPEASASLTGPNGTRHRTCGVADADTSHGLGGGVPGAEAAAVCSL